VIELEIGDPVVIFEHSMEQQSAATFAFRTRMLPTTDATGLKLWPCARVALSELRRTVLPALAAEGRPQRIVELGAGTGLLGLGIVATLPRSSLVLTDPGVALPGCSSLDFLSAAIQANGASEHATAQRLLWGCEADLLAIGRSSVDLLVGSELIYRDDSVEALAQTIFRMRPTLVVLAHDTYRSPDNERRFNEHMEAVGFAAIHVSALEGGRVTMVQWRARRSDEGDPS
jgi:hypothetical protein